MDAIAQGGRTRNGQNPWPSRTAVCGHNYGERKNRGWALEKPGSQKSDVNRWWIEYSLWLVMVSTKAPLRMSIGPLWIRADYSGCTGSSVLRIHVQSTANGIPSPRDSYIDNQYLYDFCFSAVEKGPPFNQLWSCARIRDNLIWSNRTEVTIKITRAHIH